jgi:polar amino acid transport system permease protein
VPEFTFLANQLNNRLMVYPAQIFLFVGFVYLVLCGALQCGPASGYGSFESGLKSPFA